jgi:hypothetical protein
MASPWTQWALCIKTSNDIFDPVTILPLYAVRGETFHLTHPHVSVVETFEFWLEELKSGI